MFSNQSKSLGKILKLRTFGKVTIFKINITDQYFLSVRNIKQNKNYTEVVKYEISRNNLKICHTSKFKTYWGSK